MSFLNQIGFIEIKYQIGWSFDGPLITIHREPVYRVSGYAIKKRIFN